MFNFVNDTIDCNLLLVKLSFLVPRLNPRDPQVQSDSKKKLVQYVTTDTSKTHIFDCEF
jgi:hypothetical protein